MSLKIEVGADIRQATSSFKILEGQVERLQKLLSMPNLSFRQTERLNEMLKSTQRQFFGLEKTFNSFAPSVQKATTNFTGLTRIVQDLPFGFQGIANNIQQVVPAAGALGLGISAVTSALVFAQIGFGAWTRGLGDSKDNMEGNTLALGFFGQELIRVKRELEDFTSSLDFANQIGKLRIDIAFGKGLKSGLIDLRGQSIGNLGLIDQLEKDEKRVGEIASKIRGTLIEELGKPGNNKFFEAFDKGLLSEMDDLPDGVSKAFNKLTEAEKQQADISDQLIKARQNQTVLYAQIEQQKIDIQEEANKKADEAAKKAMQAAKQRSKQEEDELKKALEAKKAILTEFQKDFATIGVFNLPDLSKSLESFTAPELTNELRSKLKKALLDATKDLSTEFQAVNPIKVPLPLKPTITWQPSEMQKQIKEFTDQMNSILQSGISNSLIGIGQAIGDSIASGGNFLEKAGASLFGSLGDMVEKLGQAMIEYGTIKVGLDKLLAAGILAPGGLLIAEGIAAVAIGAAMKSIKPKAFAQGGLVFGPTLGLVGEGRGTNRNNPEVIAPLDKLQRMLGGMGQQPIVIMATNKISGNDIVTVYERARGSQRRNFGH